MLRRAVKTKRIQDGGVFGILTTSCLWPEESRSGRKAEIHCEETREMECDYESTGIESGIFPRWMRFWMCKGPASPTSVICQLRSSQETMTDGISGFHL